MKQVLRNFFDFHIVEVLSERAFLSFTLSILCTQLATNILNITLIFLIYYLTGSNFSVSILVLSFLLPQILLSFIGGIVADKKNKRTILIYINLFRAAVVLILFFSAKSVYIAYFVSALVAIATQFYIPAESPMIPYLVKRDRLVAANSVFGMALFGSILVGYIIAGPLVTLVGRSQIFLILSILYAAAAFFAYFIPHISSNMESSDVASYSVQRIRRSVDIQLRESFSMLKKTGSIAHAFFLLTFSQVVILILATIVPGYAKKVLEIPAEDLSVLLFAPAAIGMIIAASFIGGICRTTSREKVMTYGVFISGIVLFLFPLTSHFVLQEGIEPLNYYLPQFLKINALHMVNVLAFFAGVANAMIFVPSQTIIQESTPENFQSKIYGLLFAMIGIFSLIPILLVGSLADMIGVETVLMVVGIAIVFIGLSRVKFLKQ